jgi:hypothetical protein
VNGSLQRNRNIDRSPILPKGSRNNNFQEFAPRFVADWVDLNEHNRRRSKAHVEDCAIEDRLNVARRWDAKMGSYYFASPKSQNLQNLGMASVKVDSSFLGEEDSHEWKFIKPGTRRGLRVVIAFPL